MCTLGNDTSPLMTLTCSTFQLRRRSSPSNTPSGGPALPLPQRTLAIPESRSTAPRLARHPPIHPPFCTDLLEHGHTASAAPPPCPPNRPERYRYCSFPSLCASWRYSLRRLPGACPGGVRLCASKTQETRWSNQSLVLALDRFLCPPRAAFLPRIRFHFHRPRHTDARARARRRAFPVEDASASLPHTRAHLSVRAAPKHALPDGGAATSVASLVGERRDGNHRFAYLTRCASPVLTSSQPPASCRAGGDFRVG